MQPQARALMHKLQETKLGSEITASMINDIQKNWFISDYLYNDKRRIQNPAKHLRWTFLQKHLITFGI